MRVGFGLPQVGRVARPDALVTVAQRAEALGFDDVWVFDRVLWPIAPRAPYPASPDGKLPAACKTVLDPVETLAFVAACTRRVGLGTSVLNLPYYNPVLLARQLTTIDVLSNGRLRVGFGTGWSPDEFEAVGASMIAVGKRTDEALRVLKTIWTTDPVKFAGDYYHVPESVIYPKPVQKPHPPIYWAAYTPAALRRVARQADGWLPAGIPVAGMKQMLAAIRQMAQEAGRDPSRIELVVRANVYLSETALGNNRAIFTGALEQIRADITATRELGAAALIFDAQFSPAAGSLDGLVRAMERLWGLAQPG
ncbi:MAG: LLM class F420-dependent oxidoreductase [Candidatus Binatia bacterium]